LPFNVKLIAMGTSLRKVDIVQQFNRKWAKIADSRACLLCTASVAQADHDGAVRFQKCVLAHEPERRMVAFELGFEVGLVAGCSLAFADSGFFCSHRGITGLVDPTQHERAKAIGFALGRFDAVATQPGHKEQHRHLAASVPGMGDERAELIAPGIGDPVVNDVGVLKMFPGARLLRVGRRSNQQRKAGKDSRGSGKHGQPPCQKCYWLQTSAFPGCPAG
jgi:hypothetical protein